MMKRDEYLNNLKFQLIDLPAEDLAQIEEFYNELILDGIDQGFTEEEILSKMESPEKVAEKIRAEYGGIVIYSAKSSEEEQRKDFTSSDAIRLVKVQTENLRIRVRTVQEGAVRVLFKPKPLLDKVDFEERDGVFSFVHKRRGGTIQNWLNIFREFNILILEIPVDFGGTIQLETTTGSISLTGLSALAKAELSSTNGKIKVENSQISELIMKAGNGKIEAANLIGNTLDAMNGNGLIVAKECRFPEKIRLNTQNGAVTGKNLISDTIEMQTYNGLVSGTIIGNRNDYNVTSDTKNGFNNLDNIHEEGRSKSLTARTHNGRIQIDFTL